MKATNRWFLFFKKIISCHLLISSSIITITSFQNCSRMKVSAWTVSSNLQDVNNLSNSLDLFDPNLLNHGPWVNVTKLFPSSSWNINWAYAPSIVKEGSSYYAFYCSTGNGQAWDVIRLSTSVDQGRTWSAPSIAVNVTESNAVQIRERCACDPSVVKFKGINDTREYYYIFYSGNGLNVQTQMFVARSTNINGPYLKYTDRNTWEQNPPDAKVIIAPYAPSPDSGPSSAYGAGQQTVVSKDGKLYSWFTDSTDPSGKTLFSSTENPTVWPSRTPTNIFSPSVDVKYDNTTNQFIMFELSHGHNKLTSLQMRFSNNGFNWSNPQTICDETCTIDWAHNPGVSGDVYAHIDSSAKILVGFGAPPNNRPASYQDCAATPGATDHGPRCWAHWDLFVMETEIFPTNQTPPPPPPPTSGGEESLSFSSARGKTELNILPAMNVIDNNRGTCYSSIMGNQENSNQEFIAAWFDKPSVPTLTRLELTPRIYQGNVYAFPEKFDLYLTSENNSSWVFVRTYLKSELTLFANEKYVISLPQNYKTWGVLIVPSKLSTDPNNNYYLQLCELTGIIKK